MPKKTVEEELNDFLDQWHAEDMIELFEEIIPLIVAYQISTNGQNHSKTGGAGFSGPAPRA